MKTLSRRMILIPLFILSYHFTLQAQKAKITYSCATDSVKFQYPGGYSPLYNVIYYTTITEHNAVVAAKKGYRSASQNLTNKEMLSSRAVKFEALDKFPGKELTGNKPLGLKYAKWKTDSIVCDFVWENGKKTTTNTLKFSRRLYSSLQAATALSTEILSNANLIDTTTNTKAFSNRQAGYQISLEIDSVTLTAFKYGKEKWPNLATGAADIKLRLYDGYGEELLVDSMTVNCVDIPLLYTYYYGSTWKPDIDVALQLLQELVSEGLYVFLTSPKFSSAINDYERNLTDTPTRAILALQKGSKTSGVIRESLLSTVTIKVGDGHGSGVILTSDGYIVSNYHVVGRDSIVDVITNSNDTLKGKILRIDPEYDLALIKCETNNLLPIRISADQKPEVGSDVYSVGTPLDMTLGQTINGGIISAHRNFYGRDYLQADALVSGGNSGGALINTKGELLGIVSSKMNGYGVEGICFAIPSKYIFERLRLSIN